MKKTFVRLLVIIPVIAIQALWVVLLIRWLSPYSAVINFILSIFAAFFVLYIITKRDESTQDPLAAHHPDDAAGGTALYLLFGNRRSARILQGGFSSARSCRLSLEVPKFSRSLRTAIRACHRRWAGCRRKRAARS